MPHGLLNFRVPAICIVCLPEVLSRHFDGLFFHNVTSAPSGRATLPCYLGRIKAKQ